MANNPFGGDFESLARQYWNQWGEMMQAGASAAGPATSGFGSGAPFGGLQGGPGGGSPGWNEAINWWSRLATGGQPDVNAAVGRFDHQSREWFGRIQQLAAGFVGQNPAVPDIVEAWKTMLGGATANPFGDVFAGMGGPGLQGFDRWFEQASPFISALQGESRSWLGTPAFGFAREHQERWQHIARLQVDYQQRSQACQKLLAEAGKRAFEIFERMLEEHAEPGRQLTSARALFDLWVDAAEDAYAKVAMSPRYREDFGEMVNAQMRLRAAVQHEVELVASLFGMPSRTEIDSAHRKIVQLERELRRLRDGMQHDGRRREDAPAEPASPRPAKKAVKKAAAGKTAKKKAVAGGGS